MTITSFVLLGTNIKNQIIFQIFQMCHRLFSKNLCAWNLSITTIFFFNVTPKRPRLHFLNLFWHAHSYPVASLIPVHHCCCENPTKLTVAHFNTLRTRQQMRIEAWAGWWTQRCWKRHLRLFSEKGHNKGKNTDRKITFWYDCIYNSWTSRSQSSLGGLHRCCSSYSPTIL